MEIMTYVTFRVALSLYRCNFLNRSEGESSQTHLRIPICKNSKKRECVITLYSPCYIIITPYVIIVPQLLYTQATLRKQRFRADDEGKL